MYMQDFFSQPTPAIHKKTHYYGDTVRQLFLAGGILILISMPIYNNVLPLGSGVAIVLVVILALAAGITCSKERWIIIFDTIASTVLLIIFQFYSATYYVQDSFILFIVRQSIAIIFLFALYYSAKTLRAMYLHEIENL